MCTVEARPANGSSVSFTNTTITPAGRELLIFMLVSVYKYNCSCCSHIITAPVCISEKDIIHFIGQRNVTVCINLGVLTDHFENYEFEVSDFLVVAMLRTQSWIKHVAVIQFVQTLKWACSKYLHARWYYNIRM